ncbi:hypothetical protein AB0M45_32835 [Nocardia sp. NPDC051787]|uniref:hypothetical protein n=1 Tax=Nocardia sp. NPDC051787 TaxID=3155415 RepID=UPI0034338818
MTSDTTQQIPVLREEFADQLNLLLADVVWAVERDNDPQSSANLTAALTKCRHWSAIPHRSPPGGSVAVASAVRTAYDAWRRDPDRKRPETS